MAASGGTFDDEAVHASAGFFGEGYGQGGRSDDAQEERPLAGGRGTAAKSSRVKGGGMFLFREGAFDIQTEGGRLALGQEVERTGNGSWDACTHEDVVCVGEHCAVEGWESGKLDFFEVVDAY
jgi:hypothetical protein